MLQFDFSFQNRSSALKNGIHRDEEESLNRYFQLLHDQKVVLKEPSVPETQENETYTTQIADQLVKKFWMAVSYLKTGLRVKLFSSCRSFWSFTNSPVFKIKMNR